MRQVLNLLSLALIMLGMALVGCQRDGSETDPNNKKKENNTTKRTHDDLLIEEIYYFGNFYQQSRKNNDWAPVWSGASTSECYNKYIRIVNASNEVKYLDGAGIAISQYSVTLQPAFAKSFDKSVLEKSLAVSTIYLFPGDGTTYPLQPGESKIIATSAVDAKAKEIEFIDNNPDYKSDINIEKSDFSYILDLTKADFEVNDENPNVPNLIHFYSFNEYTDGNFDETNFGEFNINSETSIALIRLKEPKDKFKSEILSIKPNDPKTPKKGKYTMNVPYDASGHEPYIDYTWGVFLPNEWVLDFVMIAAKSTPTWAINPKLDVKSNGINQSKAETEKPLLWSKYAGKALIRKNDGRGIVDTNNSSLDFEVKEASLYKKK